MAKIRKTYIVTTLFLGVSKFDEETKSFKIEPLENEIIIGKISERQAEKFAKENNAIYIGKSEEQVTSEMDLEQFHKLATPVIEQPEEDSQNETEIA